jgi:hypothetical protein
MPSMFASYNKHCVSIALQCVQAIAIFHRASALGWGSSSLPHIITNASPSLADL